MVTTDYTRLTENTLKGAPFSRYRFIHWLVDILKNFFSTPMNISDERIKSLLMLQDGASPDACASLFRIEVPYGHDSRKACTTPAVLVSAGETKLTLNPLNNGVGATVSALNAMRRYRRTVGMSIEGKIAVVTESCAGTIQLTDIISDFLIQHSLDFRFEGMLSQFNVLGVSAVEAVPQESGANAKPVYQDVISVMSFGVVTWDSDTQGPVYRGVTIK